MTTISLPLRWRDTDHLGHVYHGALVSLLDEARSRWMLQVGLSDVQNYVIARIDVSFKNEILYADNSIAVEVCLERVGNTSMTTRERVLSPSGTCAESRCTFVHWDAAARTSRLIDESDRTILLALAGGVEE